VEAALVFPVVFFLAMNTIVGAMGILRYNDVALLAREGARYASLHGGQYQLDTGNPAATATDVYNNAIQPRSVALDPTKLSYTVTWNVNNMPKYVTTNYEVAQGNTVTVTVTYKWYPEIYLIGPITLTSSSTKQMEY
jgi:Flp pilus assembly protein TadG